MPNIYAFDILSAFFGFLCLLFALVIFLKNRRNLIAFYLSLLSLFSGLWIISVYFADLSSTFAKLIIFTKLATVCALLLVANFTALVWVFKNPGRSPMRSLLLFVPNLFLIPLAIFFSNDSIYAYGSFNNFGFQSFAGSQLSYKYSLFILAFFLYFTTAIIILLKDFRKLPYQKQKQVFYISLGAGLTITGGLFVDSVLPAFGISGHYPWGSQFSVFLIIFAYYAIFKHHLLDIKLFIQKSIIYSLLLFITFSAYFALAEGLLILNKRQLSNELYFISSFIIIVLSITSYSYLDNFLKRLTDKWLYKSNYNYNESLNKLIEILNSHLNLENLVSESERFLNYIFKNSYTKIVLSAEDYAYYKDAQMSYPIKLRDEVLGQIFLGPKLSGEPYYANDVSLTKIFSHYAGLAIEKSRLHNKLNIYNNSLEEIVMKRTSQITQLQETQKQSLIDISHSLQTPLTIIKGFIKFLKKKDQNFKNIRYIENIIDETSVNIYRLIRLIKLESQNEIFKFEKINLSKLIEDILEYVKTLCDSQNIDLAYAIEPGIIISGDRQKMEEAINNILSNSIKYIANNKSIFVSLKKENSAVIKISDTGIGIPKGDLNKIFNRFYRSDNAKSTGSGSGLGLAITEQIIKTHGGSINFDSQEGVGTTFFISLPIK